MLNTNIYNDGHTNYKSDFIQFYYFVSKRKKKLVNHIT